MTPSPCSRVARLAIAPRMLTTKHEILARLDELGIEQRTIPHPPVFTVEEARSPYPPSPRRALQEPVPQGQEGPALAGHLPRRPGGRPEPPVQAPGRRPLLVRPRRTPARGAGRHPGQRDAAGDRQRHGPPVTHVLDTKLMAHELVNCHPLENDATTTLASADLLRFIRVDRPRAGDLSTSIRRSAEGGAMRPLAAARSCRRCWP